jgi:type IV secretory pathway VirB4 component
LGTDLSAIETPQEKARRNVIITAMVSIVFFMDLAFLFEAFFVGKRPHQDIRWGMPVSRIKRQKNKPFLSS